VLITLTLLASIIEYMLWSFDINLSLKTCKYGAYTMTTILTVDDSRSLREILGNILKTAGYAVVEAEDGVAGLELAQKQVFDVVLTDQIMPGMDGLMLIENLRTLPEYESTPILMLTSVTDNDMKQRGRAAGATGWMIKPIDPERLLLVLDGVIKRSLAKTH
jgi:two-component system chemotaxis response regulator CheY